VAAGALSACRIQVHSANSLSRTMIHPRGSTQELAVAENETPRRVQGVVIDTSRGALFFFALCAGVLGFAAGFVIWDTWSHQEGEYALPFHLAKDSLFTSFVVVLC